MELFSHTPGVVEVMVIGDGEDFYSSMSMGGPSPSRHNRVCDKQTTFKFLNISACCRPFYVGVDGGPTSVRRQHEDLTPLSI